MKNSRLLEILMLLMERKSISARELAEYFEVSIRTIYRDIDTLSTVGFPIYTTIGRNGGIQLMENYILNKSLLTENESKEVIFGLQSMTSVPHLSDGSTLKKMSLLFDQRINWVQVDLNRWGISNYEDDQKFEQIKQAILHEKQLSFTYVDSEGNESKRQGDPLKLIYKRRDWYLYMFCLIKNDYRLFKLTRMDQLNGLTTGLSREYDEEERKYQPSVLDQQRTVEIELHFDKYQSHRLYDIFDSKYLKENKESLILNVEIPENEWLYSFLMSFGSHVKVISPVSIREQLKQRLKEAYDTLEDN